MYRKVLKSWEKLEAVSESDGLVGQLPMGVGRMVICERCVGLILLMSKCSTTLPVTGSPGLCLLNYSVGKWENKEEIQSRPFLLRNYDNFNFHFQHN